MFELYIKYLLEGIAVAIAAYFIPRKKVEISEIIFIALSAAATFAVLDIFAPKVGDGARRGAGFGIGANTVGWPMGGAENFNGESDETVDSDESDESDDSSEPERFAYGNITKEDDKKKKSSTPKKSKKVTMKAPSQSFEDSVSTVTSAVSSVVSKVTGDSNSTDTKSTDTKSTETKSTETKSDDSSMMSMDSTGSAVMGYDETRQYSSF